MSRARREISPISPLRGASRRRVETLTLNLFRNPKKGLRKLWL